jgi:hypothetical protein
MGFKGVHYLYDLIPMLLMQQYFLRYSGYPSYYNGLNGNSDSQSIYSTANISTVLVPSTEHNLNKHINYDIGTLKRSLFIATFSLTESRVADRDIAIDAIKDFGVIYIIGWPKYENVINSDYLIKIAMNKLNAHNICMWSGLKNAEHRDIFFLAIRKDLNIRPKCEESVECYKESVIYGDC